MYLFSLSAVYSLFFLNIESIEVLKPIKYDVEKAGKC